MKARLRFLPWVGNRYFGGNNYGCLRSTNLRIPQRRVMPGPDAVPGQRRAGGLPAGLSSR